MYHNKLNHKELINKYFGNSITVTFDKKTFFAFLPPLSHDLRFKQLGILFVAGKTYISDG